MNENRQVLCADAIKWLKDAPVLEGHSFFASMPDISEFHGHSVPMWKDWFVSTAKLIMEKTPDDGVSIFFQSDIKKDGIWIDKGYLCQKAAEELGFEQLFHKIFCRFSPGTRTFGRPAYSHLLAFSKKVRANSSLSTPDVVSDLGEKLWERGTGLEACLESIQFIKNHSKTTHTLVNPFCGQGSVLAVANALGLSAIGIEHSPKRVAIAKKLQVDLGTKSFTSGQA